MKTGYFNLTIFFLCLATIGRADETIVEKVFKEEKIEKVSKFIQYNNRVMLFTPAHIGYERIKPNGMYVGVEAFQSPVFNKKYKKEFVDVELRLGHNSFYNGKDHFTPFIMLGGAGANHTRSFFNIDYQFKNWGTVYGGAGFLYTHECDSIFNIGVNAKLLLGGCVCQKDKKLGSPLVGMDVAVPFTFRFGNHKHWDFRLEPFFFGLKGQGSVGYLGWRNSLGYRF